MSLTSLRRRGRLQSEQMRVRQINPFDGRPQKGVQTCYILAQLTDSVLVWTIRQPQEVQADDKALLAALKENYAKVKSQEAYQQDWRDINQQPGENLMTIFNVWRSHMTMHIEIQNFGSQK